MILLAEKIVPLGRKFKNCEYKMLCVDKNIPFCYFD